MSELAHEFLKGIARLADLSASRDCDLSVRFKSDADAMREDWDTVGDDIRAATGAYAKSLSLK